MRDYKGKSENLEQSRENEIPKKYDLYNDCNSTLGQKINAD